MKEENKAVKPILSAPFAATAQPAAAPVQAAADRECKHPPTPRVRPDEPMHPYGLD